MSWIKFTDQHEDISAASTLLFLQGRPSFVFQFVVITVLLLVGRLFFFLGHDHSANLQNHATLNFGQRFGGSHKTDPFQNGRDQGNARRDPGNQIYAQKRFVTERFATPCLHPFLNRRPVLYSCDY